MTQSKWFHTFSIISIGIFVFSIVLIIISIILLCIYKTNPPWFVWLITSVAIILFLISIVFLFFIYISKKKGKVKSSNLNDFDNINNLKDENFDYF